MLARCLVTTADLDDRLPTVLDALHDALLLDFARTGSGGFGAAALAEVFTEESGQIRLTAVKEIELGFQALLVQAESAADLDRVAAVAAGCFPLWPEEALRARLSDGPELLVGLAMAAGENPQPETTAVFQDALQHTDPAVRELAGYALAVASELREPPVVMVARQPVAADQSVSLRPGASDPAKVGPVAWLRLPDDIRDTGLDAAAVDLDWLIMEIAEENSDWSEELWTTMDQQTTIHHINHPALDCAYLGVHGKDVPTAVAAAQETLGAVPLAGPPNALLNFPDK